MAIAGSRIGNITVFGNAPGHKLGMLKDMLALAQWVDFVLAATALVSVWTSAERLHACPSCRTQQRYTGINAVAVND